MSTVRFDSVCVPLNEEHTAYFVLADNALESVDEGEASPVLPAGWTGIPGNNKSLIAYEPDADGRGVNRLQLQELREYYWEIRVRHGGPDIKSLAVASSLEGSNRERDWKPKRTEESLHGSFKFMNYLGSAWIAVRELGQADGFPKLRFDVITAKLDYESEYRAMVEAIASECQQLLLEWGSPTTVHIASDPEKQAQTLLEQFLFLRHVLGSENLHLYLETLRRRPHTRLETDRDWRPAAIASPTLFIRDPLRFGRDWTPASAGMAGVVSGMQALEIREERRFDSLDTPANRFVKFALHNFRSLCDEVMSATISGKSLQEEQGTAWREANSMRDALDSFLSSSFFDEVGKLRRIPFESQVLQKREGYREILHAWLMLDAAAQIDWPGRNDAYDGTNRDVATLYEFWLFFVLVRAFKERLGMTPVRDPLGKLDNSLPFCCEADDGRMATKHRRSILHSMPSRQRIPKCCSLSFATMWELRLAASPRLFSVTLWNGV